MGILKLIERYLDGPEKKCDHDWEEVGESTSFRTIVRSLDEEMNLDFERSNGRSPLDDRLLDLPTFIYVTYKGFCTIVEEPRALRFYNKVCLTCGECNYGISEETDRVRQYIIDKYRKSRDAKLESHRRKDLAGRMWDDCPERKE